MYYAEESVKITQKGKPSRNNKSKSESSRSCESEATCKSCKHKTTNTTKKPHRIELQKYVKETKSLPNDILSNTKKSIVIPPKKTTKSEQICNRRIAYTSRSNDLDICTKCGDADATISMNKVNKNLENKQCHLGQIPKKSFVKKICVARNPASSATSTNCKTVDAIMKLNVELKQNVATKKTRNTQVLLQKQSQTSNKQPQSTVKQFYKNENFEVVSDLEIIEDPMKKTKLLDPISELPEIVTLVEDSSSEDIELFRVYSKVSDYLGSKSDLGGESCEADSLRKIKEFRDTNYFECHSSKARIQSKGSVTSLGDHKCVYRFYLNDRLFPEPIDTDSSRKIRCVDCHLPLEFDDTTRSEPDNDTDLNGTIQAKVKLGSDEEAKDTVVLLPVKSSLIIREKRREPKRVEDDEIYFGIMKLGRDGQSVFRQNFTGDSLALKYQKGYRELENDEELRYGDIGKGDVIIV